MKSEKQEIIVASENAMNAQVYVFLHLFLTVNIHIDY